MALTKRDFVQIARRHGLDEGFAAEAFELCSRHGKEVSKEHLDGVFAHMATLHPNLQGIAVFMHAEGLSPAQARLRALEHPPKIRFENNGMPMDPEQWQDELGRDMLRIVRREVEGVLGSVRCPTHGAEAEVLVAVTSSSKLDSIALQVFACCQELGDLVNPRLAGLSMAKGSEEPGNKGFLSRLFRR